jgi:hypothetical protein
MKCKRCGSHAINDHCHGRKSGIDLDLCDVCYWRKRAEQNEAILFRLRVVESEVRGIVHEWETLYE